ncbi:MAG: exo-alpha-sialidase [Sedimentisphaeraceae bacterium JB056]
MKSTSIAILAAISIFTFSVFAVSPVQWTAPVPDSSLTAAGLPVLGGTTDYTVYSVGTTLGTFSHGVNMSYANGIIFATWTSHDGYEGAAGSRVLYSKSIDGGQTWSPAAVIIDSIGTMADPPATGTALNSRKVEVKNGRMYMLASVRDITSWDGTGDDIVPVTTYLGIVGVNLDSNGDPYGPVFWLKDDAPAGHESMEDWNSLDSATYPYAVEDTKDINGALSGVYHYMSTYDVTASDGASLTEPTFYTCKDGQQISLFRTGDEALSLYAAVRADYNSAWSAAEESSIPDSHSLNEATVLPDGSVVLLGNNTPELYYRDVLVISRSIDGYDFNLAWALRYDPPAIVYKNTGDHKGTGYQYPGSVLVGDNLWVGYSENKESVGVTKIPLSRIMRPFADLTSDDAVDYFDFIETGSFLNDCGDPADPNCI